MPFIRVVDEEGTQRFLNTDYIVQLSKANKTGDWAVQLAPQVASGAEQAETIVITRDSGDVLLREVRQDGAPV